MYWLTHLYWPRTYLAVFLVAFFISAAAMPIAIFALRRLRVIDEVTASKIHTRPVPRGGGMVIFAAFAVAVLLPGYRSSEMNGVIIGAFVCMSVGALDDFVGGISGFWKLLTLLALTFVLWHFGVRVNVFKNAPLDILLTVVWMVGVTSAFNGLDNMDGLASGVAVIVSLTFFVIALQAFVAVFRETSLAWFGMLAIGLAGANLGFLIYNSKPAHIFMGDSGSFFIGFTLAALGIMGEWTENRVISCTIPILILGVPISDFAYVIVARILRGETRTLRSVIDHCAPDHLSHRLTWIGFSQRKAVLFIYVLSLTLGITGILLHNSTRVFDSVLGLFQGVAVLTVVAVLMATAARTHLNWVRQQAAMSGPAASPVQTGGLPPPESSDTRAQE